LPLLPRAAILKIEVGPNYALRVGPFYALSSTGLRKLRAEDPEESTKNNVTKPRLRPGKCQGKRGYVKENVTDFLSAEVGDE
jgi:hypothetical protein